MSGSAAHSRKLFIEGTDDEHAIYQLLVRRGFDPQAFPAFEDSGGKEGVLRAIRVAIRAATGGAVGFVLDANDDPGSTWERVTSRLGSVGVEAPHEIPSGGFAGESKVYAARVGVWLMPDNRQTGALEDFLRDLIDEGDPLLTHAEDSASKAKELGAGYAESDTGKAVLHTWLAWQKEPGRPYGVAIKARYFGANSAAAEQFLAWFERVFGVAPGR